MTKSQFIKRCENAWDMGLITPERLRLMERWCDFVMRFDHTFIGYGQTQGTYVIDFILVEQQRLRQQDDAWPKTLANDDDGYKVIQFASVLSHPCQVCAEDPKAWHTRTAFCPHKEE